MVVSLSSLGVFTNVEGRKFMRFFSLFPLHLQSIADLENAARLATVFAEAYTNDTLSQVDNFLKVEKKIFFVGRLWGRQTSIIRIYSLVVEFSDN